MAYLLSNLNAAYIRDALLETAKVGTYFLVYLMASRISLTDACHSERSENLDPLRQRYPPELSLYLRDFSSLKWCSNPIGYS